MLTVLTNPDRFFAERRTDPALLRPAMIVLAVAVLSAISSYVFVQELFAGLPDGSGQFGTIASVFAVVGGLVVPFALWGIYAGAFYVLSLVFDPEGSFRTLAAFTAWGYVPTIFGTLIGIAFTFMLFSQVQIPTTPQGAAQFQAQLRSNPIYQLSILVQVVFSIWRGFIWAFAVKHARALPLKHAGIVAGIPVAVGILFTVGTNLL